MAADENDRKQSLHYLLEAYRYLPSHTATIERLAAYYIEMKMYEQTIKYLERLSMIQPNEIKWQLMIAASYRRAGNYQQALSSYQSIHQHFPDNIDCLRFLIRLCTELDQSESKMVHTNYGHLVEQYSDELRRLEKTRELREEQKLTSSRSASRASTAAGRNSKNSQMTTSQQHGGSSSREGSAATTSSNGSGSSGYMTSSITPGNKSATPKSSPKTLNSVQNNVSAIVDQVVEQFDSTMDRPTTSWRDRRALKSSHGRGQMSSNVQQDLGEDFLLDANIDEMLPD